VAHLNRRQHYRCVYIRASMSVLLCLCLRVYLRVLSPRGGSQDTPSTHIHTHLAWWKQQGKSCSGRKIHSSNPCCTHRQRRFVCCLLSAVCLSVVCCLLSEFLAASVGSQGGTHTTIKYHYALSTVTLFIKTELTLYNIKYSQQWWQLH
jgi:hypothetical protein